MKPTPKQSQEIHKNYERVVEHLINEGYAEDKEKVMQKTKILLTALFPV